mgnify:CR=1 FL=1
MKKAFTMIELIFVIVVIGILAATIIPNTKRNPVQEAAIQIASHIRYTQHLAMTDDRYNPNRVDNSGAVIWFKERWQILFSSSKFTGGANVWAYTIFSDRAGTGVKRGDPNESEIAKNPENSNQLMTGGVGHVNAIKYGHKDFKGMESLNIGKKYGIIGANAVVFSDSCDGNGGNPSTRIAFDYLGRPLQGDHNSMKGPYTQSRLIKAECRITITDGSESVDIKIQPETGYVSLDYDP